MADELSNDLASLRISKPVERPKRSWMPWVAGGLLLAIGAGTYVLSLPYLEATFFKTEVQTTEIMSISPATVSTEVTASGYVVPQTISKVGSKVQGRIAQIAVTEGQQVKKGDVLIVLDDSDQRNAVQAGAARLVSAEAEVERQKAQLADVERKLKREKVLAEEGVTGRATMEDLVAQSTVLSQAVNAARAMRNAAAADLSALNTTLKDLSIQAPIDGTVLTKPPQVGEVLSPSSAPFMEIADFSSLMVEAEVPESRLSKVRIGGSCEIGLDAYPAKRYRGVVKEISPIVNRAKASVVVKVGFVGEAGGVLPNMSARAFILESEESAEQIGQPPKTVVPTSALVERNGAKLVYVIDGDRVRMAPVELGAPFGPGHELLKGPRVGTRVVKDPPPTLSEGHRIKESKR